MSWSSKAMNFGSLSFLHLGKLSLFGPNELFMPLNFFGTSEGVKYLLFFFPSTQRCGHCKKLAPEWKKAAKNLQGKVKLGHVNCDVEQVITRNVYILLIWLSEIISMNSFPSHHYMYCFLRKFTIFVVFTHLPLEHES